MIPYGRRLVELRGDKSQCEVAKAVGIATSTLGMYETEQRIPRDGIKIALANYYGTTVQEIFLKKNVTKKDKSTRHGSACTNRKETKLFRIFIIERGDKAGKKKRNQENRQPNTSGYWERISRDI